MKQHSRAGIVLFVCLVGCSKGSRPPAATSAPQQAQQVGTKPDDLERTTCAKHQLQEDGCGEYRILSYDATWQNGYGNEGAFTLERDGLTIHAHCGSENCYIWSDAVGKFVVADKSITNLITRYDPSCEDQLFVKNSLEYRKRMSGRVASVAQVCWQTLVVEKIEAKTTPRN